VWVVPTDTIAEGFAALLAYDPEAHGDVNAQAERAVRGPNTNRALGQRRRPLQHHVDGGTMLDKRIEESDHTYCTGGIGVQPGQPQEQTEHKVKLRIAHVNCNRPRMRQDPRRRIADEITL